MEQCNDWFYFVTRFDSKDSVRFALTHSIPFFPSKDSIQIYSFITHSFPLRLLFLWLLSSLLFPLRLLSSPLIPRRKANNKTINKAISPSFGTKQKNEPSKLSIDLLLAMELWRTINLLLVMEWSMYCFGTNYWYLLLWSHLLQSIKDLVPVCTTALVCATVCDVVSVCATVCVVIVVCWCPVVIVVLLCVVICCCHQLDNTTTTITITSIINNHTTSSEGRRGDHVFKIGITLLHRQGNYMGSEILFTF